MNIAIFASGNGTNAQRIAEYFKERKTATISLIATNRQDAYVLERARNIGISTFVFTSQQLKEEAIIIDILRQNNIEFIVLAGFLLKLPPYLVKAFPNKIMNIHPALLPKYGGKGMYGEHVHRAVIKAGEAKSGITIHYVNENYDEGNIIFQKECDVFPEDSVDSLAERIHMLEYKYYPEIIEKTVKELEC